MSHMVSPPTAAATTLAEDPQVLASGYSEAMTLGDAIQEAMEMALQALPKPTSGDSKIDLAIVSTSSLYDGSSSPADVVPAVLAAAEKYGKGIQSLVGSSSGGFVSSRSNLEATSDKNGMLRSCFPIEREGVPGVSIMLCILPDVRVQTFHVMGDDVPDDYSRLSSDVWKQSIGLSGFDSGGEDENSAIFLLPSPAFQNNLDDLLRGLESQYPKTKVFGAIASTVSSLSRARLFRHEAMEDCIQTLADGCVGVALSGDIQVKTMVAQGAKPVGGVYRIVKGAETTIQAIALDEAATQLVREAEEMAEDEEEDEKNEESMDKKTSLAAAYAKARIPKPILAEANFLMRTLSDDDQSFMRKALLVGIERGGSVGRTPSELARLAEGKGHQYTVHQVASAAMKDGSVTLSLGSVDIKPGTRMRFFVRESDFAKKELEALWMGYKRRTLGENLAGKPSFKPTGCFLFPTLDRGSKFFLGKTGYETATASKFLPTIPCINGFFSNGVIGSLQSELEIGATEHEPAALYGSASGYILFGSKSDRPIFSPALAAEAEMKAKEQKSLEDAAERQLDAEDEKRKSMMKVFDSEKKAPRDANGELIIKRREVHSGRALTVSAIEWSVAEKSATPSSALEGFMWDKETEVDRFRERVPLANLVSQCRLSAVDPSMPKPRDWIGPVKEAAAGGNFVIIPECKRSEPITGSLRKRYDIEKLVTEFTQAGVPAISVNCDNVLFGGSLEDLTKAREASSKAALELGSEDGVVVPPILASDLVLYPYQLYKMRLAGADAVNLIVASLASKDLLYLTKIASTLQMQTVAMVTSIAQVKALEILPVGSLSGLIVSNRDLEDFSFDMTGEQAISILRSDELKAFSAKQSEDFPVLVEGRIGLIKSGDDPIGYLETLKEAGAMGAVIAGGIVPNEAGQTPLKSLLKI
eukprot:scaffold2962_cov126-Cylindrotheca_fusiformis.AAC.12